VAWVDGARWMEIGWPESRVAGGGAASSGGLTGGSPTHTKTALPCTKQSGKGTKRKMKTQGIQRSACRGRRGVGGGERQRGRSSGSVSLGAAVYWRGGALGSGAGWRGVRAALYRA
jgi:hypothetical protein